MIPVILHAALQYIDDTENEIINMVLVANCNYNRKQPTERIV
jgi:hypothetical protein